LASGREDSALGNSECRQHLDAKEINILMEKNGAPDRIRYAILIVYIQLVSFVFVKPIVANHVMIRSKVGA